MSRLDYLPPSDAFLDSDRPGALSPEAAKAVVIPFGLEKSLTFAPWTAAGPAAMLVASREVELFDEEAWCEPVHEYEVATLAEPAIVDDHGAALDQIEELVGGVVASNRFPLVLGGEHSLTIGAVRPFAEKFSDLVILQFDAHADLRDGYQGNPNSHAAAMRRVLDHDDVSLVGVGLRNIAREEAEFYAANLNRVQLHFAKDMQNLSPDDIAAPLRGKPIYVSFDVDCFDASLMPATGTPEPGGLFWNEVMEVLLAVSKVGHIVGADIVELSPRAGLHACDFVAAKLGYKLLSYALAPQCYRDNGS